MKKMNMKTYITVMLFVLVLFNFAITQYDIFPVLKKAITPVVIGFVIAYFLDPLVRFITRISKGKIKRGLSIFLSILIVLGFLVVFGAVLVPSIISSISDIVQNIEKYVTEDFDAKIFERFIGDANNDIVKEVITYVNTSIKDILLKVGEFSTVLLNSLLGFIVSASSGLINFIMAFVISLYMLADKKDLLKRIKRFNYAVNDKETADTLLDITKKSDEIFNSFFVGKIIDSAIIGVLCFIIMWLFKIPNSPAIAFIIGLTNVIPYFGPFIGAVPAILVTLASGNAMQVVLVAVIILALQQFDGLYLGPKILGDKVGVRAFWIIVSVTVGGSLFGVVGMFLGVPVVVLIKTLIEEFVERKLKEKNLEV